MNSLNTSIIAVLIISFLHEAKGQQYKHKKIDSLISGTFQLADRNEALKISDKTYKLSEDIGYYQGKAKSLKADLNCYLGLGEQEKALKTANKLYDLAKKENDDYHCGQAL
ncbi:MAG: hypothetical protein J0I88_10525, partial [Chryseobacterium sp.]|nr:hypothetical protein [Chryseobacterium sp.]